MTIVSALALEDGTVFRGTPFGAPVDAEAEVVFNTAMTGYQEIATDPSYRGQMVTLTYPLIGNYGVCEDDAESRHPWISALIVRDYYDDPSNWKSEGPLARYLKRHGIPGLSGIDTRALTRRLRARGTLRAVLVHDAARLSDADLAQRARSVTRLEEKNLVEDASIEQPYIWPVGEGYRRTHVVVMDCGIKENILRSLGQHGVALTVVPFSASADEILGLEPHGIVVSNGPGDPARLQDTVGTVRELIASQV
ncbi:MAG TPA: carbamoyl phosphate synthase small subunit, partial [Chloroflexota bacterium]|nr:carbamoyl phosphate synthase small subunit [Chloroflexota bacterium]